MRKSIFHETWWLDAIAPGRWRQIDCVQGGRTTGSLPFVEIIEGGLKICAMPPATHVLGPTVADPPGKTEASGRARRATIRRLLGHLDGHDHVEMVLDTGFADLTPFLHAGFEVKPDPTFLLDCRQPLEALWAGLRDKTRNVIRRAREQLTVGEERDIARFARYYEDNLAGDDSYFDIAASCAAIAAAHTRQQARILAARDVAGVAHAMTVFLWDERKVYYFHSSRIGARAHIGAVSLLVWSGIELAHSLGLGFDFDGGLLKPSRYKFLASFGGEIANRYEVTRSNRIYRIQHFIRRVPRGIARRVHAIGSPQV
ncbi:MAG: GNAT family N-acetyltransferase [Hyphomicrobiaceae bacterium]|nr:GNAT family N-acetyltransferase [Hyphomicrobiaceae bacterium]